MLSLLYLVVRAIVGHLVSAGQPGRADGSKDLEIHVLRHQLRVLQRTSGPLKLRAIDRALLAAASRVIPRDRWVAFLVSPATLLRWQCELVRRKWTYRRTGRPGWPPIDAAIREFILRLARPSWVPLFTIVAGLGTNTGGVLCHAAVVARESGLPAVVGVAGATTSIADGRPLEIDGVQGIEGRL